MNLKEIQYFVTLAEQQHFGKAAELCFVSQPTLSMQIQKLERELGVKLFERSNKSVNITAAGKDLVTQAKSILNGVAQMREQAKTLSDPLAGEIKIGIIPTLGPYLLPLCLRKLNKQLPKLKTIIIEDKTDNLLKALDNHAIDAAILALPINSANYVVQKLFKEEFLFACSKQNPLADKKSIKIDMINPDELLLLAEGHCLRGQALELCKLSGGQFSATSLETLKELSAANLGVTILPRLACKNLNKNLVIKKISANKPHRQVAIIWRKTSSRTAALNKISEIVAEI
jgi:LysR family transcriptional regulator, hydrogen peroxide-inducible genes activator